MTSVGVRRRHLPSEDAGEGMTHAAAWRTMSAHFADHDRGALVLPATMTGMIEASATETRDAMHAQLRIDHRIGLVPHAAGADRIQV